MPGWYRFAAKLARQFKNLPVILLLAATVIAVRMDEVDDAVVLTLVALLHTVLGTGQAMLSGKAKGELKGPVGPEARVGIPTLPTRGPVPGKSTAAEAQDAVPAQKKLGGAVKELNLMVIGFCLLVFLFGLVRGYNAYEMFLAAVSLAVVAVPDGLPALARLGLVLGFECRPEPRLEMFLDGEDFGTIVRAGQGGRGCLAKKAACFTLACRIGEVLTFFSALLLGWPLPLHPLQLLWINLVTDTFPSVALGIEPPVDAGFERPPFPPEKRLFGFRDKITVSVYGVFLAVITLLAFRFGMRKAVATGQTMAFATLGLGQLIQAFVFSFCYPAGGQHGLFANRDRYLLFSTGGAFLLQFFVFFTPLLRGLFRVRNLSLPEWLTVLGLIFTLFIFGELWRYIGKKVRRDA